MTIPLAQVKAVCNESEVRLVQASRRPQLSRLTLTEAKRYAIRARKHFDKWQDQSRGQSRTSTRTKGVPVVENRSTVKMDIFRETLDALEAQVAKLEAQGAKTTGGRSPNPPKTVRNRGHRAERSDVRGELNTAERKLNAEARKARKTKAAEKAASATTTAAAPPAENAATSDTASAAAKPKRPRRSLAPASMTAAAGSPPPAAGVKAKNQLRAKTVAKKNRIATSGATTRTRGHISARGRRSQGRKDSR